MTAAVPVLIPDVERGLHIPPSIDVLATWTPGELRAALDTSYVTPVVPIECTTARTGPRRVFLKLEGCSLAGSVKERTARSLIHRHRMAGRLGPGATLVESTSGNLGVALALIARACEFRFVAVVDPRTTPENVEKMRLLGAEIVTVDEPDDSGGYLLTRLRRVAEIVEDIPGAQWSNQYGNPANPRAHLTGTAPELFDQMRGRLDALFVAVSTCGTLAGLGRFFRRHSPHTRIVAVDAVGSAVFGAAPATRRLVGIGSSRRPDFDIAGLYDDVVHVTDEEAFATCRELDASCGLSVGGSSGAVLAACGRYLDDAPELQRVVCLCPDSGVSYRSTIWNDAWLRSCGLDPCHLAPPAEFCSPKEL
jgi:N-(2-amino-2-carboxyethyl)-L-glutamate synthase